MIADMKIIRPTGEPSGLTVFSQLSAALLPALQLVFSLLLKRAKRLVAT